MSNKRKVNVKRLGVLLFVVLLLPILAACTSTAEVRTVIVTAPAPAAVPPQRVLDLIPQNFDATMFLATVCGACHGSDLKGKIGPNLVDAALRLSAVELAVIIAGGRHGTSMPAWSSVLTPAQIEDLVQEIPDWNK